jgi:predicted short-subunit dehydrogenase-like oxidoreductase (DUF2520 family)
MKIVLVGPGRAGTGLGIAMQRAGHDVVAVAGRDPGRTAAVARRLDALSVAIGEPLPAADLVVIAVRDDAIAEVAASLADAVDETGGVVHLSGATSVASLDPITDRGIATGSFHPLQTLPSPEAGAERIDGAWVAITAVEPLRSRLHDLATSIGARPFDLDDDRKALYHAAASAAANFPVAALGVAHDLFASAGVPFEAARPLVEAAVSNAFAHGPRAALTGPIARGDRDTVAAQLEAVTADGQWPDAFRALAAAVADYAGTAGELDMDS